jgi:predicted ATPase/class 3 adenylate cyclase
MGVQAIADPRSLAALSSFFGREDELAQLRPLLARDRLVTITGIGGVGKTRLALALGSQTRDLFPDGVWLVELARVENPALVPSTIADSVRAQRSAEDTDLERAAKALSVGRQLLILDNCEHLIEAAARACTELLTRCPELSALATAREPLNVQGEHAWPVPPLGVPPAGVSDVATIAASDAVQLFVDRARLVAPTFKLGADNVADIAAICRRLDGIPLALELAAAWVPVLSLKQIAARLDDSLALLSRGGAEKLPRHRTMRAALDWSHELLTPSQQAAFARLSVFVGGFSLDGAEALLTQESTVLELLAALVARSLVLADTASDEARYRFLEPVRQYAAEMLRARPDDERTAHSDHLLYLTQLAETAWDPLIHGPDQPWLRRLETELANIRVGLAWGWDHDYDVAARLATSLMYFCLMRDLLNEGREWAEQAMRANGRSLARACLMAGDLAARMGDVEVADPYLARAQQLATDCGWFVELVLVLLAKIVSDFHRGHLDDAEAVCGEALRLAERLRDENLVAVAHSFQGQLESIRGNHPAALEHYLEVLPVWLQSDHQWLTWVTLDHIAALALDMGDQATARQAVRHALEASPAGGRDDSGLAYVLENAGILAIQLDDPLLGLRLMAAANAMLHRTHYGESPDDAARRRSWVAHARERAGAAAADAAWRRGLAMSFEDATSEATEYVVGSRRPTDSKERTFMFTDIVGSTELVGVIGDNAWHDLLDWHNRTLRETFLTHGGEEIDSAGDGFFVAFQDAQSATDCAIELQRTLDRHRRNAGFAPRVRIGLHTASATRSGTGYRGKGVHVAARVAAQASGDEILATDATTAKLDLRYARSTPSRLTLKGVSGEVAVESVHWK